MSLLFATVTKRFVLTLYWLPFVAFQHAHYSLIVFFCSSFVYQCRNVCFLRIITFWVAFKSQFLSWSKHKQENLFSFFFNWCRCTHKIHKFLIKTKLFDFILSTSDMYNKNKKKQLFISISICSTLIKYIFSSNVMR